MIVRLNGGLGNQLFQAAFGISVAKKRDEPVAFDRVHLDNGQHRAYGLGAFNIDVNFMNPGNASVYGEPVFKYDPGVYNAPRGSYFVGNWQTEKYFDHELVYRSFDLNSEYEDNLNPETWRMHDEIRCGWSCFVHVRRTDYLVPSVAAYHGNMSMDYYDEAMQRQRVNNGHNKDLTFYIFSDDPDWCQDQFTSDDSVVVGHNKMGNGADGPGKEHEDLWLMSNCDHAIIPNSSFAWWGAWLGDFQGDEYERLVIAPEKWFANDICSDDIVPDRWLKI